MNHTILIGDVQTRLAELPDKSVRTCVTSPPYWGLRDYGVEGQLGLESTPEEYVNNLVAVFRQVKRVLTDNGTLWLNLGDSYVGGKGASGQGSSEYQARRAEQGESINQHYHNIGGKGRTRVTDDLRAMRNAGLKPKDLVGIPWRVAFALQADGWYLRQDIIWAKPNPMPESVRDRCTKSHEYLFLLSKSPRYYFDHEAIKEPAVTGKWDAMPPIDGVKQAKANDNPTYSGNQPASNGLRNKRDVWTIPTKPFKGAHFAVMPEALVEPCVLAGSSEHGGCVECGTPWSRVLERPQPPKTEHSDFRITPAGAQKKIGQAYQNWLNENPAQTVGWKKNCHCPTSEVRPDLVLDPFTGSGTVAVVALKHGRSFIGVELNPDYAALAQDRIGGVA